MSHASTAQTSTATPTGADAPGTSSQEAAQDRRAEFVPVAPGGETSSAATLLITAYILMWALIFGLVLTSQRRQKKLELRLSELEAALARVDQAAGHGHAAATSGEVAASGQAAG